MAVQGIEQCIQCTRSCIVAQMREIPKGEYYDDAPAFICGSCDERNEEGVRAATRTLPCSCEDFPDFPCLRHPQPEI